VIRSIADRIPVRPEEMSVPVAEVPNFAKVRR
jgi:hypothetical protein